MRVVFFGTPEVSVPTLRAIVTAGHEVVAVVTQPDRRRGRGGQTTPSPVKAAALELGLPVVHRMADVLTIEADLGVLVAFGRLIKRDVLDHLTIVNLHPSLLPRWRGATPVEASILAGDERTGICLMRLEEAMDAGAIYASTATTIEPMETASALYARLFAAGNQMLVELLGRGLPEPLAQVGDATYCAKLTADDFHIDWRASAEEICRLTRIGRPWTTFRGRRFLVIEANPSNDRVDAEPGTLRGPTVATADGMLDLVTVQPEGKPPQPAGAWANGARLRPDERFA